MYKAPNKKLSKILNHTPVRWSEVKEIVKTHKVLNSLHFQALKKASLDVYAPLECTKLLLVKSVLDEKKLKQIFLLAASCNNINALSIIINYCPSTLFLADQENETMLHLLCRRHGWNETIEFVLKEIMKYIQGFCTYHAGLFERNFYDETPLQLACQADCNLRQIMYHIESDYPIYFQKNLISFFECIAEILDDADTIQKFVDDHEHAIELINGDGNGNTPLYYACYYHNSVMIQVLLKKYATKGPIAAAIIEKSLCLEKQYTRMTPLGLLLRGLEDRDDKNAWECIEICMDFFNDLPILRIAIDQLWDSYEFHRKGVQILKRLTNILGLEVNRLDHKGNSILHTLILKITETTTQRLESRGHILEYFLGVEGVAYQKDKQLRLPLHIACEKGLPLEYLLMIINAYPAALEEIDKPSGLLPFMLAAANHNSCKLDVIYDLIRNYPSVI
jgi:hypothetical protein